MPCQAWLVWIKDSKGLSSEEEVEFSDGRRLRSPMPFRYLPLGSVNPGASGVATFEITEEILRKVEASR